MTVADSSLCNAQYNNEEKMRGCFKRSSPFVFDIGLIYRGLRAETARIRALPPAPGTGRRVFPPLPEGGYESGYSFFEIQNSSDNGYFFCKYGIGMTSCNG